MTEQNSKFDKLYEKVCELIEEVENTINAIDSDIKVEEESIEGKIYYGVVFYTDQYIEKWHLEKIEELAKKYGFKVKDYYIDVWIDIHNPLYNGEYLEVYFEFEEND